MRRGVVVGCLILSAAAHAAVPAGRPGDVGVDGAKLAAIDEAVRSAIEGGKTPGAVVLVLRSGKVGFRKAYGRRAVAPEAEAMTADTVFALASLTKPVATATSLAVLARQGKVRLDDPVVKHLPAFRGED